MPLLQGSPGIILIMAVTALIFLYLVHRTLHRMRMSFMMALVLVAIMLAGGMLPPVPLIAGLAFNLGGFLIPLGICVYLLVTADEPVERIRALLSAAAVALFIWTVDRLLPLHPGAPGYEVDPLFLPAVFAAAVAYLAGRSRRSSFIGGVLGIYILDLAAWVENMARGFFNIPMELGGAGIFDPSMVAGVLAVMLAELVGEIRERMAN